MDSHFAKPHAFLVCGPGLGHVNGCVALAKSLVSAGFSVTLACFARCYHTHSKTKRLKPLDPAIRFEIVPDGLEPPVAQNYADLFVTTEAMREGLESLVEKLRREEQHNPVTCFVSDFLMAWTQDVANKLGVPRIEFFTSNATTYLVALALPQLIAEGYYTAQKDEASGQPFLWVLRSDATTDQAGLQLSDILPLGFQTQTQSRGLIAPWVPQLAVLAHPAVGGFLTHCGWNSTLETLWMGVPMLCCPRGAEQKTNARFIAQDWGVGIELQRTDTGGFHRCEVEKSVKALMTAEEGLHARTRAQELKGLVRKAKTASHSNLVAFVNDMTTLLPYDNNVHKKAALGN